MMEEGIAFCPQCNAPQIRVAVQEMAVPPPVAEDHPQADSAPYPNDAQSTSIDWPQAFSAVAWAGLIAALALMIPLGGFILATLAAGALSVLLYRRRRPNTNFTAGMGARLGALSGVMGFGIAAVLLAVSTLLFHTGGELRGLLLDALQQQAARNPTPEAQQVVQFFKTPQGLAVILVAGLVMMFIAVLIFSSIGGALGASLLRRKHKRE
jgi:hypothetical protein